MKFTPALASGHLVCRYKRFLADVRLADGSVITMHCPNTGSMKNCAEPESRIWYSRSENKTRKYPETFELVEVEEGHIAGINTHRANSLVKEAIDSGLIIELDGYQSLQAEVRYGRENSRIDFVLGNHLSHSKPECYVEVKNVTLSEGAGLGLFPDSVSSRGLKHLRELMQMRAEGYRAVLLFCVQHTGINQVQPADSVDPAYGLGLRQAAAAGVEIIAYKALVSPEEIKLVHSVPVILPRL